MKTEQEQWIEDFVHGKGAFADLENLEHIDRQDLKRMRFHLGAADRMHEDAKLAETGETERLRRLAKWHFYQVDQLLGKYGKSKGLKNPFDQSTDEIVEQLLQFVG